MRYSAQYIARVAAAVSLAAAVMMLASCAGTTSRNTPLQLLNDMRQQQKYKTQGESRLAQFDDGRSDRRPVPGTVARGEFHPKDDVFYTGVVNSNLYTARNPLKITPEVVELGQQRFNTYCSPCHGRTGNGKGIVGARTNWIASSLIDERVRNFADGDFFDVISHGRRTMPAYRYQISEHDRWAIISYIRALQRASNASFADVPQELRSELH